MEFDIYFKMGKDEIRNHWLVRAACDESEGFNKWFEYKFLKYGGWPDTDDVVNLKDSLNYVMKYE
jgi:hypothetical protein